eukprot:8547698-Pyramimonas_sp.AAC.1
MKKAAERTKAIAKVRRIARLRRVSQGLWRTGCLPQAIYDRQQMGLSEYEITNLRRRAGRSVAGNGPG